MVYFWPPKQYFGGKAFMKIDSQKNRTSWALPAAAGRGVLLGPSELMRQGGEVMVSPSPSKILAGMEVKPGLLNTVGI